MSTDRAFARRAVVQHPDNPMITEILECTQHLRPTDDLHDPFGISVDPLPTPQCPLLPPGPPPATPVVTPHTQNQAKREPISITRMKQARAKAKIPFEEAMRLLDEREATILAKMRSGAPPSGAEWFGDLFAVVNSRQILKEKARLEKAGGSTADRLAQRQKKMAEELGVPTDLLP